jgi:hypothetical protein
MTGIILVGVLNIAMFAWFLYLAAKDPSNVFKRRRPPTGENNERPPTGADAERPTGDDSTTPPEA